MACSTCLGLGLEHASLDILLGNDGFAVDRAVLGTDVALGVSVELGSLGHVEVHSITQRHHEEAERHAHGLAGTNDVGDIAENDWANSTTADGGDEERSTALSVSAKTAY